MKWPRHSPHDRAGCLVAENPAARRIRPRKVGSVALLVVALLATWLMPAQPVEAASAPPPQHWVIVPATLGQNAPASVFWIFTNGPPDASVPIAIDGRPASLRFHDGWAEMVLTPPGAAIALQVPPQVTVTQDVTVTAPPKPAPPPVTQLPFTAHHPSRHRTPKSLAPTPVPGWLNTTWNGFVGAAASFSGTKEAFAEFGDHAHTVQSFEEFLFASLDGRVPGEDSLMAKMTGHNVIDLVLPAGEIGPTSVGTYELVGGRTDMLMQNGVKVPVAISRYTSEVGTQVADAYPVISRQGVHLQSPVDTSAEVAVEDLSSATWWGRAARFGDVLGLLGVGVSCIQGGYEIVNQHNYKQGVYDLGQAVGAALSFEAVGWGMAIGGALGDGPGLIVGAVAGFAVGAAMPWLVGHAAEAVGGILAHTFHWPWGSEANAANVYAPDIFFVNHTGRRLSLSITESGPGTYNVRPAWTHSHRWQGILLRSGRFRLIQQSKSTPYLHYEASGLGLWQTTRGWIIPADHFASWASTTLAQYGFPKRAIVHFIARWSALSKERGWLAIYPQTAPSTLDVMAPLRVTPTVPIHRVWFAVQVLHRAGPWPPMAAPAIHPSAPGPVSVWEWGVTFLGPAPAQVVHQGG